MTSPSLSVIVTVCTLVDPTPIRPSPSGSSSVIVNVSSPSGSSSSKTPMAMPAEVAPLATRTLPFQYAVSPEMW